jgi:hypothetical protein
MPRSMGTDSILSLYQTSERVDVTKKDVRVQHFYVFMTLIKSMERSQSNLASQVGVYEYKQIFKVYPVL